MGCSSHDAGRLCLAPPRLSPSTGSPEGQSSCPPAPSHGHFCRLGSISVSELEITPGSRGWNQSPRRDGAVERVSLIMLLSQAGPRPHGGREGSVIDRCTARGGRGRVDREPQVPARRGDASPACAPER